MEAIIKGRDLSCYEVTALALAESKNENIDGHLSKFIVFTAEDVEGGWGKPVKNVMFDDVLGEERLLVFEKYVMRDETTQQPITDAHGGKVISLSALKKDAEAMEVVGKKLIIPGGEPQTYILEKGECFANDKDGKPTLDKSQNPVKRTSVEIFCQVKYATIGADGQLEKHYASGMSPEAVGQRMESRFYKYSTKEYEVVNGQFARKTQVQPQQQAPTQPQAPTQASTQPQVQPQPQSQQPF